MPQLKSPPHTSITPPKHMHKRKQSVLTRGIAVNRQDRQTNSMQTHQNFSSTVYMSTTSLNQTSRSSIMNEPSHNDLV